MAAPGEKATESAERGVVKTWRWFVPVLAAAALLGNDVLIERVFPPHVPAKGSVAKHAYRAAVDAVFDLHESYVAEAREARQSYLPIYIKDTKLLHVRKEKIVAAALKVDSWGWPALPPAGAPSGVDRVADGALKSAADVRPDGGARRFDSIPAADADARAREGGTDGPAGLPWQIRAARRRDLQALLYGCFRLLERYYEVGVVPDAEFPNEKEHIRVFVYGRYSRQPVTGIYRFSALQPALERGLARFFYRVPAVVRAQAVDFVLQRLPANLRYAAENKKFIADISQVTGIKVVRIRRGDLLVSRGKTVDTRAHHAIAASVRGAGADRNARRVGRLVLLLALLSLFLIAGREMDPVAFGVGKKGCYLVISGLVLIVGAGHWALLWWPIHIATIPQAAITLVVAVVYGRRAAVTAAVIVAAGFGISTHFDLAAILVAASGGVVGALVVRHRRRAAVVPAGIIVGLAQALAFEATRAAAGRAQTYQELWGSAQAFAGGVLAGMVALALLPFVQRWLGMVSRGELRVLSDYDHPILRRLREEGPEVFAHSLRVLTLADRAAKAVGADRMLARVGSLYHDVGWLDGEEDEAHDPRVRARQRLEHVARGVSLLQRERVAREVVAIAEEHHGTLEMDDLVHLALAGDEMVDRAALGYRGPRPRSLESAIVMVANEVDRRARTPEDQQGSVERVVVNLLAQFQFAECRITQRQIRAIERAMAEYRQEALTETRGGGQG